MGGIDQLAVAADGPHTVGLGAAVGLDRVAGLIDLLRRRGEDLFGARDLVGVDGPLAVEAEQAGVHGGAPEPVGVLVRRVGRIDGVDARGPGRGQHLHPSEVPEVTGVFADRIHPWQNCGLAVATYGRGHRGVLSRRYLFLLVRTTGGTGRFGESSLAPSNVRKAPLASAIFQPSWSQGGVHLALYCDFSACRDQYIGRHGKGTMADLSPF